MQFNSHWLWRDVDVLLNRQSKAAAVIAAVARVAEAELPKDDQVRCFARAFGQYGESSREAHDRLVAEPYTYYRGRPAYELLQLTQRPDRQPFGLAAFYCQSTRLDPRAALARHLAEFSRFPVAAACLDGTDLSLDKPLFVSTPFALPGTPLSVDGPGDLEIFGVRGGTVDFNNRSSAAGKVQPVSYPIVESTGCHLRLQPAVFSVIASGIPEDVSQLDLQIQIENKDQIEDAVTLLNEINPDIITQFQDGLRVVALRPRGEPGALSNVSHCDLPGAIAIYAYPNPHEVCNILLHEFLHNRLFALEEQRHFPTSEPSDEAETRGIYSPWRRDYRPAHGLLHAVYVFTGVGRYWFDVVNCDNTPEQVRDLARTRIMHGLLQVRIGLTQLRNHARLTEIGKTVLDLLQEEHEALWNDADGVGLSADMPMRVFRESDPMCVGTLDQTPRSLARHHLHKYAQKDHAQTLSGLIAPPSPGYSIGIGDRYRV